MPLIRRTVTPKAIASRRRNSRKSTGPRTERGKRQVARNGSTTAPVRLGPLYTMGDLEEKPHDYEQLLEGLRGAFQPANPAEACWSRTSPCFTCASGAISKRNRA